jgi:hypothetical protein
MTADLNNHRNTEIAGDEQATETNEISVSLWLNAFEFVGSI